MQIDIAFILAAGKGTRMLEIGKVLPKPLWPVFDKTLLELQVDWCLSLGIKNIYVNTHYLSDLIHLEIDKIEEKKKIKIKILHEDPLLDSGGNVHNLANQPEVNYKGHVLIVNADQFYFFAKNNFDKALKVMSDNEAQAILFGLKVKKDESYNEIILNDQNRLIEIAKPKKDQGFYTYSGLGIVNLEKLEKVSGISKFFESVADYKNKNVMFFNPITSEYWDFGTFELYIQSIFKIFKNQSLLQSSKMIDFLKKSQAIKKEKFIKDGYINFLNHQSIDLGHVGNFKKNTVTYKEVYSEIK